MKGYLLQTAIFPAVMLSLAFIPMVNLFCYSLHGGHGWIFALFSGPLVVGRLTFGMFLRKHERMSAKLALACFGGYIAATFVLGLVATRHLENLLGVTFSHNAVWATLNMPWSLLVNSNPLVFK